jgi:hypothetical protein
MKAAQRAVFNQKFHQNRRKTMNSKNPKTKQEYEYNLDRDFDEQTRDTLFSYKKLWDDTNDRLSKVGILFNCIKYQHSLHRIPYPRETRKRIYPNPKFPSPLKRLISRYNKAVDAYEKADALQKDAWKVLQPFLEIKTGHPVSYCHLYSTRKVCIE